MENDVRVSAHSVCAGTPNLHADAKHVHLNADSVYVRLNSGSLDTASTCRTCTLSEKTVGAARLKQEKKISSLRFRMN